MSVTAETASSANFNFSFDPARPVRLGDENFVALVSSR
jgi:hypothetical protein